MLARRVVLGLALFAVLTLSACGSSSKSSAPTATAVERAGANPEAEHGKPAESAPSKTVEPPTTTNPEAHPEPKSDTGGFSGQGATNYENAKAVCGSRPRSRVATRLGLRADAIPRQIAQKYSEGHRGTGRARFEGCLAGARSP
jgi:hypothetical protein